jgi:gamma-glutamylcyclotransferase (GGCT)/AIG2-like uncharacterized protein YtfP
MGLEVRKLWSSHTTLSISVISRNRKYSEVGIYFGYGANTNIDAMALRCPAARRIGTGILREHKLAFRAVADIEVSEGTIVHGALWVITPECEASLDAFEGFPHLYDKKSVNVTYEDCDDLEAMVYVLRRKTAFKPPAADYAKLISQGYRDFSIPMSQLSDAVEEAERAYNEEIEQIYRMELGHSIECW